MAKMKIKELADELGADSKEIIKFLNDNGFEAKSSTKGIEDEQINLVKNKFGKKTAEPAEKPEKRKKNLQNRRQNLRRLSLKLSLKKKKLRKRRRFLLL